MRTLPALPLLLIATLAFTACSKKPETAASPPPATAPSIAPPAPASPPASLTSTPAPIGAKVFFVGLKDGDQVTSPLTLKFGAEGIEVAPAGEDKPNSGHHHLVIDGELPPPDSPAPATANLIHYGKGQTEATINLTPGKHTLQLSFANYLHVAFNPPLASDKITVNVK